MPILPPSGPGGSPAQPGSYCPQDAINLVQQFGHGIPVTAVQAAVCDMVSSMIWTFYPWTWSLQSFTPLTCVNGQQDYGVLNSNVLRPVRVRLVRTDITPNEYRELGALANLSPELSRFGGLDSNTSFGYFAYGPFIRLLYAASVGTGQVLQIQGEYQRTPVRITDANMTDPFPFPDRYYNVFVEGLKWKIYQLGDDPRAGSMVYVKNAGRQYTGQLGLFMDAILQSASTEDLQNGDEFEFPEQGLGVGRSFGPGIFGI